MSWVNALKSNIKNAQFQITLKWGHVLQYSIISKIWEVLMTLRIKLDSNPPSSRFIFLGEIFDGGLEASEKFRLLVLWNGAQ